MQIVFPVVTKIQTEVISKYGFSPDGEGVIQVWSMGLEFCLDFSEISRSTSFHISVDILIEHRSGFYVLIFKISPL
jgi:hypothetical protein